MFDSILQKSVYGDEVSNSSLLLKLCKLTNRYYVRQITCNISLLKQSLEPDSPKYSANPKLSVVLTGKGSSALLWEPNL